MQGTVGMTTIDMRALVLATSSINIIEFPVNIIVIVFISVAVECKPVLYFDLQ